MITLPALALAAPLALAGAVDPGFPTPEGGMVMGLACTSWGLVQEQVERLGGLEALEPPEDMLPTLRALEQDMGGLDPAAPVFLSVGAPMAGRQPVHLSVGLRDPAAARAALDRQGAVGELQLTPAGEATWATTLSDGDRLEAGLRGPRLVLSVLSSNQDGDLASALPLDIALPELLPAGVGCELVLRPPPTIERAPPDSRIHIRTTGEGLDHLQLELVGELAAAPLDVLGHKAPREEPLGRSAATPALVLRLNADPEHMLRAMSELPPPFSQAGGQGDEVLQKLRRARVNLGVGSELAVFSTDPFQIAAVVVVRRPWNAARVLKRLARHLESEGSPTRWEGELLVIGTPRVDEVFLGANRDALVVSTSAGLVQEVLSGQGQPWVPAVAAELAGQPGVFGWLDMGAADLGGLGGVPIPNLNSVSAGMPEQLAVQAGPGPRGGVQLDLRAEGLGAYLREKIAEEEDAAVPEPSAPAQAEPPRHAAMDQLDQIAAAQARLQSAGSAYVGYLGGPRALDELNADVVLWEGIPALSLPGGPTACHFEISLESGAYTARALCDEDGDGVFAIFLAGPDRPAYRLSPPEVR